MERQDAERTGGSQRSTTSGQNNDKRNTTSGGNTSGSNISGSTSSGSSSSGSSSSGNTSSGSSSSGKNTSTGQSTYRGGSGESRSNNGNDMLSGIKKTPMLGVLGALAAGALLFRGATGRFPFTSKSNNKTSHGKKSIEVHSKVTVNQSRQEVYDYWRNLENLPNFMTHLEEINELDDKTSTWTAKIPGGIGTVEWDAEIVRERRNHLIAWRSLPDSEIENSGEVRFEKDPRGNGTIVETTISYRPPAGEIGEYAAKLFNPAFEKTIKGDLKQFKKIMEKGGKAKRRSSSDSRV